MNLTPTFNAIILTTLGLVLNLGKTQAQTSGLSKKSQPQKSRRDNCKRIKAGSLIPVLKGALTFKPRGAELQNRLAGLNTDLLCDCYHNQLETTYGAAHVQEMDQYQYSDKTSPAQILAEGKKKDDILFACFGQQIGKPQFSPPPLKKRGKRLPK